MENKPFWWLKSSRSDSQLGKSIETNENLTSTPLIEEEISSSLAEFIEKERDARKSFEQDEDVGSIIEKMNRLAAESPFPYENENEERSVEDIMKEAERIYMESSKSFEQLSIHSKTSQNLSDMLNSDDSDEATPTPKSASPLPLDYSEQSIHVGSNNSSSCSYHVEENIISNISKGNENNDYNRNKDYSGNKNYQEDDNVSDKGNGNGASNENTSINDDNNNHSNESADDAKYSDDFCNEEDFEEKQISHLGGERQIFVQSPQVVDNKKSLLKKISSESSSTPESVKVLSRMNSTFVVEDDKGGGGDYFRTGTTVDGDRKTNEDVGKLKNEILQYQEDVDKKEGVIKLLIMDNNKLKDNVKELQLKLEETLNILEQTRSSLRAQNLKSPEINIELDKVLEELKDTKEVNTSLQLQLDTINKTHQLLKTSYEDVLQSNKNLERRVGDTETMLSKYKTELLSLQKQRDKLIETEDNLNRLLEIEKLQGKSWKIQTEKDAKCIMDLNRQIKEMERIIARKHPDSISALIVASKNDPMETNLSARRVLEDRIKNLEQEAVQRDSQSSKIFLEVQEKFNQMKLKYENHIEDLELHVNDLKDQLKKRIDSYDVYTQTFFDNQKIPEKETSTRGVQVNLLVENVKNRSQSATVGGLKKSISMSCTTDKEETHLLATIRGFQADLSNKEKVIIKLQKEIDELRKTNRRLQKEREGSLKSLSDKKHFYSSAASVVDDLDKKLGDELKAVKSERDKMKLQLVRIEDDYQNLKAKRIQDLTALQEAHEREIATYLNNITPLREQLEVQQVSISTLQTQLSTTKEELAIITVERDHLNNRICCGADLLKYAPGVENTNEDDVTVLRKKIAYLESKHQEREHRLHAIVHGLSQKNVTNRSCEQCAARQQQLIGYKAELDQLLATLRCLQ